MKLSTHACLFIFAATFAAFATSGLAAGAASDFDGGPRCIPGGPPCVVQLAFDGGPRCIPGGPPCVTAGS